MTDIPVNLPNNFYVIVGVLLIANAGVILTLLAFIFKAGMFVSDTKAGIKDAKESAVRAHKRIDHLEK